jgi:hypothetical protein
LTGTKYGTVTFGETGLPAQPTETSALFDGSTGYIKAPTVTLAGGSNPAQAQTLIAWVKITGAVAGAAIYLGDGNAGWGIGVGNTGWDNWNTGTYCVGLFQSVAWLTSSTYLSLNTWHMLALVINASHNPTMYLDGVQVYTDSTNTASNYDYANSNTWIGWDVDHNELGAAIAEAAIIGSALTQSQLAALYAAASPSAPAVSSEPPRPLHRRRPRSGPKSTPREPTPRSTSTGGRHPPTAMSHR